MTLTLAKISQIKNPEGRISGNNHLKCQRSTSYTVLVITDESKFLGLGHFGLTFKLWPSIEKNIIYTTILYYNRPRDNFLGLLYNNLKSDLVYSGCHQTLISRPLLRLCS